jgi:uncharacterized membrane protein
MKYLLPYRYKKIGSFLIPICMSCWLLMQLGVINNVLLFVFNGTPESIYLIGYRIVNVSVAVFGFFGFIIGLYMVAFSKQKIEDEMVQQLRLESFQFAALTQLIMFFVGFLIMILTKEPHAEGMMFFFVLMVFIFWIVFISRFYYQIHFKHNND